MNHKLSKRPPPVELRTSAETQSANEPAGCDRHAQISEAAYFRSEERRAAGEPPDEFLDWIEAERKVHEQAETRHNTATDKRLDSQGIR